MSDDLLHQELPDRAHETLRRAVVAAIDGLTEQIERIDNAFLMLSVTADFSQATRLTVGGARSQMQGIGQQLAAINTRLDAARVREDTAQADIDALQDALAALTDRVAALESPKALEV